MTDFFRFPHTPHLAWIGDGAPRSDKVLSAVEARSVLAHDVRVEEKVDGANVGLSVDEHGQLRAQSRGTYLERGRVHSQFKPLFPWLDQRRDSLTQALSQGLILFGEWCYAVHSIRYTKLPNWFLTFDVFDRTRGEFWSAVRRDELVAELGLELVPRLGTGHFDLKALRGMMTTSKLGDEPAEGLYVRYDEEARLVSRAKLVRPEFAQAIDEHWSRRTLESNRLAT